MQLLPTLPRPPVDLDAIVANLPLAHLSPLDGSAVGSKSVRTDVGTGVLLKDAFLSTPSPPALVYGREYDLGKGTGI